MKSIVAFKALSRLSILKFFYSLVFSFLFSGLMTQAQTPQYGVYLGFNSSNMRFNEDGTSIKGSSVVGLRLSGVAELPVTEQISVMALPGISMKGTSLNGYKLSLTYLDIPIYGVYNYEIGPGKALGGFGPYVGFALAGKADGEKVDFKQDGIKRRDVGVNFMLGYEMPDLGLRAMIILSPGIANISDDSDLKTRNSSFGFGVAYIFKK